MWHTATMNRKVVKHSRLTLFRKSEGKEGKKQCSKRGKIIGEWGGRKP